MEPTTKNKVVESGSALDPIIGSEKAIDNEAEKIIKSATYREIWDKILHGEEPIPSKSS